MLTTLGIVIGVGAVIAMMEIGEGSSSAIQKSITSMGANVLLVVPGTATSGGVTFGAGSRTTLTPEDGEAILRDSPAVRTAAPIVRARTQVVYGNRNWVPAIMLGTSAAFLDVRDWDQLAEGEVFTDRDVLHKVALEYDQIKDRPVREVMTANPIYVRDTDSTAAARSVHSMVTQGHVNINRFLSTTHSYLRLLCSNGQRLFVELEDEWHLLDVPSAFEIEPNGCRWIFKHGTGMIEVRSSAPAASHVLTLSIEVLSGEPIRFLISNHVAINGDDGSNAVPVEYEETHEGIFVRAVPDCDVGRRFPEGGFRITFLPGTVVEGTGRDELLFAGGFSRNLPFLCMVTAPVLSAGLHMLPASRVPGLSSLKERTRLTFQDGLA